MNENKFDKLGEIYKKFRPSYPKDFINYLYSDVGFSAKSKIADIGSGTGILTKQLLEQGSTVFAVEPNSDMRKIAIEELTIYPNFISVNSSAENTSLKNNSVDFITVAQAFHWFNYEFFKQECQRILSDKGKVVLVWNSRYEKSENVIECDLICKKYCPNFKGFSGGIHSGDNKEYFSNFFSNDYQVKHFQNNLLYNEESFIGRQLSSSYSLKNTDKYFNSYIEELKSLFNKYSKHGIMTMPNITRCYIGCV